VETLVGNWDIGCHAAKAIAIHFHIERGKPLWYAVKSGQFEFAITYFENLAPSSCIAADIEYRPGMARKVPMKLLISRRSERVNLAHGLGTIHLDQRFGRLSHAGLSPNEIVAWRRAN